jgi:hypothetical protein
MMQTVWQLDGERGCSSKKRWNDQKLDTQSHRTTRFANHNLTWASPKEAPLLPIAPQMRLLGFLSTHFLALFGLMFPGSVMAMAYRSHKGRGIAA